MEKQIPIYFDSVIVSSPLQRISENNKNLGRLQVRVFTKYANRNGSYISDAVADQLIASATTGHVPVVGFFDPQTKTWASHTGPKLANAYGYVEDFVGWQAFTDTDGQTRDYAVFSVILFTQYFEEAQKVLGQNQSMELDPKSITGEWTLINDTEYFVYKTAEMLGFCIIGDHEPCFSVSAFFSKEDDTYNTQYDKFSSLLSNLKAQVEEATIMQKGGEQPMNDFENQEVVNEIEESQPAVEPTPEQFNEQEGLKPAEFEEQEAPADNENSEFEQLQQRFNDLEAAYADLEARFNAMQEQKNEFQESTNNEIEMLRQENEQLQASVQAYEALKVELENARKNVLIEKYEEILNTEEISPIKERANDFSYDELESKLAIAFANKMTGAGSKKVPLPEPEESQFALLMKKYRKN